MQSTESARRGSPKKQWESHVRRVDQQLTPSEINLILKRIVANLQSIQDSPALEQIAQSPQAHPAIMTTAADALHHCTELKLRVRQVLDGIVATELDEIFEEVGWF